MTPSEIERCRLALTLTLRAVELRRHEMTLERVADPIDQMVQVVERDREARLSDLERRQVREIKAAIDRIRDGEYGQCEECEEPISSKRLQALPWARLCIQCQSADEVRGRTDEVAAECDVR